MSRQGCRAEDGVAPPPLRRRRPQPLCGLDVTTVVLGPALLLGPCTVPSLLVQGDGRSRLRAEPAAGPASPLSSTALMWPRGTDCKRDWRPCAHGHRVRQPPLPTHGWSHREAEQPQQWIQTSRGAHGPVPSRPRARGWESCRWFSRGPGVVSGGVLGVWAASVRELLTFLGWRFCRAALAMSHRHVRAS